MLSPPPDPSLAYDVVDCPQDLNDPARQPALSSGESAESVESVERVLDGG